MKWNYQGTDPFSYIVCIFSNLCITERLCPKHRKFFMQASLVETFMWKRFQVKIQKDSLAANVGCYRKKSLKARYLARNNLETRTFFTIDTAHKSAPAP